MIKDDELVAVYYASYAGFSPSIYTFESSSHGGADDLYTYSMNKLLNDAKRCLQNMSVNYELGKEQLESSIKTLSKGIDVMTFSEFLELQKNYYISKPLIEIDESEYNRMLGVLPPYDMGRDGNLQYFIMSEFDCGTFSCMYAHDLITDKYYSKIVDVFDKETYISKFI